MRFNYYLLGEILRERRIELGFSKNKLAQYVGISQPEVTRIENGTRTVPNIITLIYMCEVLGLDFINLLKITGYVDRKNLIMKGNFDMKKYKVNAKKDKEIEFIVYADDEEKAIRIVEEVLEDLDLSDEELEKISKIIIDVEEQKLEEKQEEIEEKSEKSICETCEYFCSECGRCTLEH